MNLYRMLAVLVAALALAACGGAPSTSSPLTPAPTAAPSAPPTAAPEPTAAPAPAATAAPAPAPTAAAGTPLVVYHKTGGIMGLDETLTVAADGALTLNDRKGEQKTGQASPAQLAELTSLLGGREFAGVAQSYQAPGADMFMYDISVPASGKTITTMDGAEHPPVLGQLISALEALRAQLR